MLCGQVLVEAETRDGQQHSILLQNAETVRLIGPQKAQSAMSDQGGSLQTDTQAFLNPLSEQAPSSEAISVSELQIGQPVYLHLQGAARHTGISIQENIVEK